MCQTTIPDRKLGNVLMSVRPRKLIQGINQNTQTQNQFSKVHFQIGPIGNRTRDLLYLSISSSIHLMPQVETTCPPRSSYLYIHVSLPTESCMKDYMSIIGTFLTLAIRRDIDSRTMQNSFKTIYAKPASVITQTRSASVQRKLL